MSDNPEEHVMTFWEHLEELRARMVRMILAFIAGGGVAWYYRQEVLDVLTDAQRRTLHEILTVVVGEDE